MEIVKNSSIDLNWLYKKSKQITLPKLVYIEKNEKIGGLYAQPSYYPYVYGEVEIQSDKGILFVSVEGDYKSAIAHEWRHHWQKMNGWKLEFDNFNYEFNDFFTYRQEIVRYFKENKFEMDALLFENKFAPSDLSSEWLNWIKNPPISRRISD